jgi:SAM-dependent methyltransferase
MMLNIMFGIELDVQLVFFEVAVKKHRHVPGHKWVIGLVGLATGAALLIFFPHLKGISGTILGAGLFHIAGALVLLRSGAVLVPSQLVTRMRFWPADSKPQNRIDFGWTGPFMSASWMLALAFGSAALGLQLAFPRWWPLWFVVALLATNFWLGGEYLKSFSRIDYAALPMVDLVRSREDRVLDVGCGAGRTALAIGRVIGNGFVTCLDEFDAGYIRGGGRKLLLRNLELAGIHDRAAIVQGNICAMPFADHVFDAAVSAHAIDHLGSGTEVGLREVRRVLKPGGRFLMIVAVREWRTFGLSALFGLFAASKAEWRDDLRYAGFAIVDEGMFNHAWYVLAEKRTSD